MDQEREHYAEPGPIGHDARLRALALILAILTALAILGWSAFTVYRAPAVTKDPFKEATD